MWQIVLHATAAQFWLVALMNTRVSMMGKQDARSSILCLLDVNTIIWYMKCVSFTLFVCPITRQRTKNTPFIDANCCKTTCFRPVIFKARIVHEKANIVQL